jgi:hypothetical protein
MACHTRSVHSRRSWLPATLLSLTSWTCFEGPGEVGGKTRSWRSRGQEKLILVKILSWELWSHRSHCLKTIPISQGQQHDVCDHARGKYPNAHLERAILPAPAGYHRAESAVWPQCHGVPAQPTSSRRIKGSLMALSLPSSLTIGEHARVLIDHYGRRGGVNSPPFSLSIPSPSVSKRASKRT